MNRQKRLKDLDPIIHQICVPEEMRIKLLESIHAETLHAGVDKTYLTLKSKFWWPAMYADTRTFVSTCGRCFEIKPDRHATKAQLHSLPVPKLFGRLHVDHMGPIKVAGPTQHKFKHVLVMIDSLSQACELVPVETTSATETACAIYRNWIMRYSCPQQLISDRGKAFCNKLTEELFSKFGIKHLKTSAYHPATNGKAEKHNQVIIQGLRVFCDNQANWPDLLPTIRFVHMATVSKTLNCSPYFALYKQEPRLGTFQNSTPSENLNNDNTVLLTHMETEFTILRNMLQENVTEKQEQSAKQYNKTAGVTKYLPGQIVYIRNEQIKPGTSKKLQDKFLGPYSITEQHDNDVYTLVHMYTGRVYPSRVHANRMRLAHLDRTTLQAKYTKDLPPEGPGCGPTPAPPAAPPSPVESSPEMTQNTQNPEMTNETTRQHDHLSQPTQSERGSTDEYNSETQPEELISCEVEVEGDTSLQTTDRDLEIVQSQTQSQFSQLSQSLTTNIRMEDISKRRKQGKEIFYYVKLPSNDKVDKFCWLSAKALTPSIVAKYEARRQQKRAQQSRRRRHVFGQRWLSLNDTRQDENKQRKRSDIMKQS